MLRIGDDVSRLRVGEAANRATHSRLSTGVMRQGNAHLAVDILHETGAIPTGRGIAAGHIRNLADELVRERQQAGHAGPIRRRHGEGTAAAEVASSGGTRSGLGLCLSLGLLLTLLWGAITALGLWMLALLRQYSAEAPTAMAAGAAYYVALILPLGAACWVFPILSRCAMSFGALNKTALKFAAGHLPSTVVLVLMTAEIARLSVRWLFPLAFMPAVLMLLWSLFTEPAFKKHGAGIAAKTGQENTEDAADASEKE